MRRAAARRLRQDLGRATTASAQSTALARFLAARTGEPDAAWFGRDVRGWAAENEGLDETLVAELSALEQELDEQAWAANDQPLDAERIRRVAEAASKGGLS